MFQQRPKCQNTRRAVYLFTQMDPNESKWTQMDPQMDPNGLKWTQMDTQIPKWTQMDTQMKSNGLKWTQMDTQMDKIGNRESSSNTILIHQSTK